MATKYLDADGGTDTYTLWSDWVSYVQALTGLSAPEELLVASAREFNGGNAQLTGGTVSASPTNQIIIRPVSGKEMLGDLTYGSGARVLFDGAGEQLYINWENVVVRRMAFNKTTNNTVTNGLGMAYIPSPRKVDIYDTVFQTNAVDFKVIDDRGSASGVRDNILTIRASGGNSDDGIYIVSNMTYRNCGAISTRSSGRGMRGYGGTPTFVNCYSFGYWIDYASGYSTNSKFNATWKTAGSTGEAVPSSGAVFQLVSADFQSSDFSSPDFRVASGSTKLKDVGVNTGGTTTDIYGQSIASSARDIGPYEFQSAPPPPPPAASTAYPYNPLGNLVVDLGGLRYH